MHQLTLICVEWFDYNHFSLLLETMHVSNVSHLLNVSCLSNNAEKSLELKGYIQLLYYYIIYNINICHYRKFSAHLEVDANDFN